MGTALGGSGLVAEEEGVCDAGETELEDMLIGESAAAGEGDMADCRGLTAGCCRLTTGCRGLSVGGGASAIEGSASTIEVSVGMKR
jgi:hypothetical protein